jgi:hypothetical protein
MSAKPFTVSDLHELRVMQRVFREAKFCVESDDDEISSSPVVAKLFTQLIDALISTQVEVEGEGARERWTKWLDMSDMSRSEWTAALNRAKNDIHWPNRSDEERMEYSKILLSPFVLSEERLRDFIESVSP